MPGWCSHTKRSQNSCRAVCLVVMLTSFSPRPLSSRHLGECGKHGAPLTLLAYNYVGQRLRQQAVQYFAQHSLQHRLSDCFTLDGLVGARRFAAVIELGNGEATQARTTL